MSFRLPLTLPHARPDCMLRKLPLDCIDSDRPREITLGRSATTKADSGLEVCVDCLSADPPLLGFVPWSDGGRGAPISMALEPVALSTRRNDSSPGAPSCRYVKASCGSPSNAICKASCKCYLSIDCLATGCIGNGGGWPILASKTSTDMRTCPEEESPPLELGPIEPGACTESEARETESATEADATPRLRLLGDLDPAPVDPDRLSDVRSSAMDSPRRLPCPSGENGDYRRSRARSRASCLAPLAALLAFRASSGDTPRATKKRSCNIRVE